MKAQFISTILALLVVTGALAQNAYQAGEKLRYIGSYNSSGVWSDIAELRLEVHSAKTQKTDLLRLVGTAQSYSNWDNYFKIRDTYQSWIDAQSRKPLLFKRNINEGNFSMDLKYVFKHKSGIIESTVSKQGGLPKEKKIKFDGLTYDMLSALYWLRDLNIDAMQIGQTTTIQLIIDEKREDIIITYMGREKRKAGDLGEILCYKMRMQMQNQKILKNNPNNYFWLSADNRKVPVHVRAEIPVGSVQIRLTDYTF